MLRIVEDLRWQLKLGPVFEDGFHRGAGIGINHPEIHPLPRVFFMEPPDPGGISVGNRALDSDEKQDHRRALHGGQRIHLTPLLIIAPSGRRRFGCGRRHG